MLLYACECIIYGWRAWEIVWIIYSWAEILLTSCLLYVCLCVYRIKPWHENCRVFAHSERRKRILWVVVKWTLEIRRSHWNIVKWKRFLTVSSIHSCALDNSKFVENSFHSSLITRPNSFIFHSTVVRFHDNFRSSSISFRIETVERWFFLQSMTSKSCWMITL